MELQQRLFAVAGGMPGCEPAKPPRTLALTGLDFFREVRWRNWASVDRRGQRRTTSLLERGQMRLEPLNEAKIGGAARTRGYTRSCAQVPKPSDGLEPSTPSLTMEVQMYPSRTRGLLSVCKTHNGERHPTDRRSQALSSLALSVRWGSRSLWLPNSRCPANRRIRRKAIRVLALARSGLRQTDALIKACSSDCSAA